MPTKKTAKKTATKKSTKKAAPDPRAVLVTTQHRGVFFGYADDTSGQTITLKRSRLALYWSKDVKGFMGLAATGPTSTCRIGPAVPAIEVRNVTAVVECSAEAAAAWEGAPWSA